jgi:sulfur relay (sulfurtransferase) complex TusBCD TusD component (DsrE family)
LYRNNPQQNWKHPFHSGGFTSNLPIQKEKNRHLIKTITCGGLMKIGIVLSTNDPEEVWNAFRFGNVALKENHAVRVFLVNKGVEAEDIKSERFPVKEQLSSFIENKGELLACGTCMKARMKESSDFCPIATMKDLLDIVEWSDKLLTFG